MEGKRYAWELFFKKFHKLITGVIYKKSLENPEDNIQVVYLKLVDSDYKLLRNFRGTNYGAFIIYLKEICTYIANDENKKVIKKSSVNYEYKDWYQEIVDDRSTEIDDENKEILLNKVMELDLPYREVLVLRSHGYKAKEIAEMLKVPLNTVLSRIKRGIDKLKKNNLIEKNNNLGNKIRNKGHQ